MEHRTKRNLALINLINEFEVNFEKGFISYLDVKSFSQLIEFYEIEDQLDKAVKVTKLALKQYKYRAEFYITLSNLLLKTNKVQECLFYLEKAQAIAPYENEITLLKARAFTIAKKYHLAFECLEEVSLYSSDEDLVEMHICEAEVHHAMQSFDMMYESLKSALQIDPENVLALERIWLATELSRKYIDCIDFHKSIIDSDPYNHLAWFNLGHALAYEGDYEDSAHALEYSFLIHADFEEGYMDCADILMQISKFDKALAIYEEAIEVFGEDSDLLTNVAECLLKLDRVNEAKYHLYKAVRLEPHSDEIYHLLGECYSRQEKWYSAINAYHKAIEIEDGSEDYYLGLARAYIAVEEYNKATVNFQLAVSVGPEQTKYWLEFASFMIKMGLYDEAIRILDEAEDFTFGADLIYVRALANFFNKNKKEGLTLLEEALQEDISQYPILFSLAPELEVDTEINSMINYFIGEA